MQDLHTYEGMKGNRIFEGCEIENEDDYNKATDNEKFAFSVLAKIRQIPMGHIFWGVRDFRQYEFDLNSSYKNGWGVMHLFIKDKDAFFKKQPSMKLAHKVWQKIPLTFKTLSAMTEDERQIVWADFDCVWNG